MSKEVMDELKKNPKLLSEYDETFSNEERVSNALNLKKSSFVIKYGDVEFDDLSFTEPIKKSRKETYLGMTTSIKELGILTPIHVMVTEGYANWLDGDMSEEFLGFKYIVIDGFRRVYGGVKTGLKGCKAVIWEFEDKDLGSQLITSLSRLLNKVQEHTWGEKWYLYQILELQTSMSPGTLEYLLSLESGDAMKLKDIMLCDYPEVIDELLTNKKTLTQCYNTLQKLRKEEDKLMVDDARGISEIDTAEDIVDKDVKATLSDNEVMEMLDMLDDYGGELSEEDFDELAGNNMPDERQKVGERHPLDPALKAETLIRDHYTCQCCGAGKELPMKYALSILQSHHIISVANSGTDTASNIVTVCQNCHTTIHTLIKNSCKFGMSKTEFDTLSEHQKEVCSSIMKFARVDYEAGKRLGKNKDDFIKDNKNSSKFKMPGTDLSENMKALEGYAQENS